MSTVNSRGADSRFKVWEQYSATVRGSGVRTRLSKNGQRLIFSSSPPSPHSDPSSSFIVTSIHLTPVFARSSIYSAIANQMNNDQIARYFPASRRRNSAPRERSGAQVIAESASAAALASTLEGFSVSIPAFPSGDTSYFGGMNYDTFCEVINQTPTEDLVKLWQTGSQIFRYEFPSLLSH